MGAAAVTLPRQALRPAGHALVVLTVLGSACDSAPREPGCGDTACDLPRDRADLLQRLAGFGDPVASWLRGAADPRGNVDGDHEAWLAGLRAQLGCSAGDEHSFVVLSNQAFAPKAIVAQCTSDPVAASRLFAVFEPDGANGDLDPQRFRLAAWDPDHAQYRRYQVAPRDGALTVAVEPEFCGSCHGGPFEIEAWTPIMNEMTNPWAQWNAEPGFESFAFATSFPADAGGPVYDGLTQAGRLDSAANLEPIVRAAIDRTTAARVQRRGDAPSLDAAAALVRPVFCDENANYVSEVHDTGELRQSAVLDPGLVRALAQVEPENGWSFPLDDTLVLPPPAAGEALVMIAVRGETTLQMEQALRSRGVLAAIDVLRVRALDWQHPFDSELRCGLWHEALARAHAGGLDPADYADAAGLARALFDDALVVGGGASLADAGTRVVALADAGDAAAVAELRAGRLDALAQTPAALGDAIEAWLASVATPAGRDALATERVRRGCSARRRFPIAPLIPGTQACP